MCARDVCDFFDFWLTEENSIYVYVCVHCVVQEESINWEKKNRQTARRLCPGRSRV